MLHVRVVCPEDLADSVLRYLEGLGSVINLVHLAGVAKKPAGDLITCDVAREDTSLVLAKLRGLGCQSRGSISIDSIDASISTAATRAEAHAEGEAADAVIWEQVSAATSESAELSHSYLLFMVLAACIASVGLLTDSAILLIGAMVVGPEFGPLAGLCVAVVQGRGALARRSARALAVGLCVGIGAAAAFAAVVLHAGLPAVPVSARVQTAFVSHPDAYAAIVALLAGVAGMFSLTTAKPGALIGVFISVTTIPVAADIGLAMAAGNLPELRGAAVQLGLNLVVLIAAGLTTLAVQRRAFRKRWKRTRRRA